MAGKLRKECDGRRLVAQRTIGKAVRAAGVSLHSGEAVDMTLRPLPADAGIVFRRTDLRGAAMLKATPANVVGTTLATTLGDGLGDGLRGGLGDGSGDDEARVATVEHLMAAFAGLGIDNARVDVNGPELPILDGSAAPFVALIRRAGIVRQPAPKRFLKIVRTVTVADRCAVATLSPHDGFRVEYTMNYDHPFFAGQSQHAALDFSTTAFVREVSRARTFGFLAEIEDLRAMGLARGGSLDNAVVVDDEGILNDDGLRFEAEFVKHKMLDAIGDLYIVGHPIVGAFSGRQSGHGTNNALLRKLLADPSAFEWVTFDADSAPFFRHRTAA